MVTATVSLLRTLPAWRLLLQARTGLCLRLPRSSRRRPCPKHHVRRRQLVLHKTTMVEVELHLQLVLELTLVPALTSTRPWWVCLLRAVYARLARHSSRHVL